MTRASRPPGFDQSETGRPVTSFGAWIIEQMDRKGWTQKRLAEEMGVTRQAIQFLLYTPVPTMKLRTAIQLKDAFGVRLDDVAGAWDRSQDA